MRVALVCPYDLGVPGGVQHQSLGLARALQRAGEEVRLFAPGRPSLAAESDVALALVGAARAVPANGSLAPVCLAPAAAARLVAGVRAFRPDVVHVEEPFAPLLSLTATAARLAPSVGTFHRAGAGAGYRRLGVVLGPLAGRLGALAVVSEEARATAAAVIGARAARAVTIPNGVELPDLGEAHRGEEIVFVGRLEERKGLGVLLAALAESTLALPVVVIGDGPQREALMARYGGDRVRFLGAVDDASKAAVLARAAVVVAPALGGESFGIVLLEAMAAGAAVVASDLPGYREAGGDAVAYVPPGDPAALRARLETLFADPEARAACASAGRTRAASFALDAIAERYRELYGAVVSSRAAGSTS